MCILFEKNMSELRHKQTCSSGDDEQNDSDGSHEDQIAYYEETSESEPEFECDMWDDDCKVINTTSTNGITGRHLMATCMNDPNINPTKKRKLCPSLHDDLIDSNSLTNIRNWWSSNTSISNKTVEIITDPFKICIIKIILQNQAMLEDLRQALYETDFNLRNMDLYEFFQSKDLQYLKSSEKIKTIYDFLKNDVMKWVATITDYNLTHMSATCSLYSNTDYLLVHDDQREDRMVAFILYLTDSSGWQESDGGGLQLFSKDINGQPLKPVRDVFPVNNQLIFFPVTNDSYHQVAEITSLNKYRLSINGWFHTRKPPIFDIPAYIPSKDSLYSDNNNILPKSVDINLESWINDEYLDKKSIKCIQKHIEENSEISLKNFFKSESFSEILTNLQNTDLEWTAAGPLNRYSYEIACAIKLPHIVERFLNLFQSKQMFELLHRYTDLELNSEKASMKFELQRWTPGSYALLTEYNWKAKNELDLIIYFGCKSSLDIIGARTQYVTIEDEVQNALITIEPEENNLNIVYRDSARFTKYFSKQSKINCFYTLICSYSE